MDGIDLAELAEELAPIAVARLVVGELCGEAFVVGQTTQKVGLGAGFVALELLIGDVGIFEAVELLVDGGAHFFGCVAGQGDGVDGEQAGVLVAGEIAHALGVGGDLLVANQAAVEAGGSAVGEHIGDGVVDGVIGVAVIRFVVALDVERLGGFAQDDASLGALRRLDRGHALGPGTCRNGAEIALQHGHGGGCLEVADDGDDDIRGGVVGVVEELGFGGGDLADLAGPAYVRAAVGVRHVGGSEELLDEAAGWGGVGAQPAFFHDDVAFLVELAQNGMSDATAFEIGPEFEAIGGHAPEVLGGVLAGGGVDADGTVLLGDFGELVGNDELLGRGDGLLDDLLEGGKFGGVATDDHAALALVGGLGHFDLGERDLFVRVVGGADVGGALEGHVFEHVRESALAAGIIGAAGVDFGVEREDRRFGAFADDQGEAVGQNLDGGSLFETCQILRCHRDRCRSKHSGKRCCCYPPPQMLQTQPPQR